MPFIISKHRQISWYLHIGCFIIVEKICKHAYMGMFILILQNGRYVVLARYTTKTCTLILPVNLQVNTTLIFFQYFTV